MTPEITNDLIRLVPLSPTHRDAYVTLAGLPEINARINEPMPYLNVHFEELFAKTGDKLHVWMIERDGVLHTGDVINTATRIEGLFQGGYWIDPHAGKLPTSRRLSF